MKTLQMMSQIIEIRTIIYELTIDSWMYILKWNPLKETKMMSKTVLFVLALMDLSGTICGMESQVPSTTNISFGGSNYSLTNKAT